MAAATNTEVEDIDTDAPFEFDDDVELGLDHSPPTTALSRTEPKPEALRGKPLTPESHVQTAAPTKPSATGENHSLGSDETARASMSRARSGVAPIPSIGIHEIFAAPTHVEAVLPALHGIVGRCTLVYGLPNVGKSLVLEDGLVALTAGQPWLGYSARAPMRGLWLDGEVGPLTLSRIQRLARARGVGPAEIGDRLRLAVFPDLSLDDAEAEKTLIATCEGFDVVFLDSLTALVGEVDENTSAVGRLLTMLARVSTRTNAAFVVLHHARRDGEIRGSTSIKASSESHWRMVAHGPSIKMLHERSPIGALLPEVRLRIRDIAIDGDALGGLSVALETDAATGVTAPAATATQGSLEREVIDYLTKHEVFRGGVDSLAAELGRKDTSVRAVFSSLERAGTVVRSGTGRSMRLYLGGVIR